MTQKPKRKKQAWMELSQEEIDGLDGHDWQHYKRGGCLCAAHSDRDCICGAWDRKDRP